jgi:hypothetical protein
MQVGYATVNQPSVITVGSAHAQGRTIQGIDMVSKDWHSEGPKMSIVDMFKQVNLERAPLKPAVIRHDKHPGWNRLVEDGVSIIGSARGPLLEGSSNGLEGIQLAIGDAVLDANPNVIGVPGATGEINRNFNQMEVFMKEKDAEEAQQQRAGIDGMGAVLIIAAVAFLAAPYLRKVAAIQELVRGIRS